jgi:hypothetical protein
MKKITFYLFIFLANYLSAQFPIDTNYSSSGTSGTSGGPNNAPAPPPPPYPACIYTTGQCNLICNGDFEYSTDPNMYGYAWFPNNYAVNQTIELISNNNGTNTVYTNIWTPTGGSIAVNLPGFYTTIQPIQGNNFLGFGQNSTGGSEGAFFKLKKPLIVGKEYTLKFWIRGHTSYPNFELKVLGSLTTPCDPSIFSRTDGVVSDPPCTYQTLQSWVVSSNPNSWIEKTVRIIPNAAFNYLTIYGNTMPSSPSAIRYGYFDDFRIYEYPDKIAELKAETIVNKSCFGEPKSITYKVCLASGSPGTNLLPIKLKLTIPSGFAIIPGSNFDALGEYTIAANTISATSCKTLTLFFDIPATGSGSQTVNFQLKALSTTSCLDNSVVLNTPLTINYVTPIVVTATITQPKCPASTNGKIILNVTGGSGSYTYLWENSSKLKDRLNLGTGGYTVTITDGNGCVAIRDFKLVNETNGVTAIIKSNYNCATNTVGLTAVVTSGPAPYLYAWSTGATGASIASVNRTTNPTVWLTITDANGCQTVVKKEIGTIIEIGSGASPMTYPTATSMFGPGKLLPNFTALNLSDKIFLVKGTFTSDYEIFFKNCDFIGLNSSIIKVNGPSINVPSTHHQNFFADNCNFYSCTNCRWKGIELAGYGSVNLSYCSIEDAWNGVEVINDGSLSATNNIFKNNFVGIVYTPYTSPTTFRTYKINNIINNKFIGPPNNGNIKDYCNILLWNSSYSLQGTGAILNKAWTGIELTNTEFITISNNQFLDLKNGMVLHNVKDFHINTNTFENITKSGVNWAASYNLDGTAVYAYRDPSQLYNNTWSDITGKGKTQAFSFKNCDRVYSCVNCLIPYMENCNILGSKNILKGIDATNLGIINCSFEASDICLDYMMSNAKFNNYGVELRGNDFNLLNSNSFNKNTVRLDATPRLSVNYGDRVDIISNRIKTTGTAGHGMYLSNLYGREPDLNTWLNCAYPYAYRTDWKKSIKIVSNEVNIASPSTQIGGIKFENMNHFDQSSDYIYSSSYAATSGSYLSTPTPIGITYLKCNGTTVKNGLNLNKIENNYICNTLTNMSTGVLISGISLSTSFSKNKFNNHKIGLKLDNTATLQTQTRKSNLWNGVYATIGSLTTQNFGNRNPFEVGVPYTTAYKTYWSSGTYSTGMFNYKPGVENPNCTVGEVPAAPPVNNGVYTDILERKLEFEIYDAQLAYQNEQEVYEELRDSKQVFEDTSLEQRFLDAIDTTTMALFQDLKDREGEVMNLSPEEEELVSDWRTRSKDLLDQLHGLHASSYIIDSTAIDSALSAENSVAARAIISEIEALSTPIRALMAEKEKANLKHMDRLLAENNAIKTSFSTELLQKKYNALLYETYGRGNTALTDGQIQDYTYLAYQCPLINGDVVYRSRAVVRIYNDSVLYDDYEICMAAGYEYKSAKQKPKETKPYCSLVPNPSSDYTQLVFSTVPEADMTLYMTNLQGQVVFTDKITVNAGEYKMSTKKYANGIYLIRLISNKQVIFDGKLEINH